MKLETVCGIAIIIALVYLFALLSGESARDSDSDRGVES